MWRCRILTRNFQQWQKCYCSCDLSDHWTDFILDSFLRLFSGCTVIFCIFWTQYQTAIFQGPLHLQHLRWLPPVSELNTCITILQHTKQGISFSLLHYKATLLSRPTSYPQQISPTAILVLLQIVQKICPINGLAPNFKLSVFVPGIALGAKTVNMRYFHPNPREGWRRCHYSNSNNKCAIVTAVTAVMVQFPRT